MTTSCQTDVSPKHYFKGYKKIKNELLGQRVSKKHKQKFVHSCLTFGIYCVSYTFCLCLGRLFLCFTQFGSSQSHCLNCHEFHDTASFKSSFNIDIPQFGSQKFERVFSMRSSIFNLEVTATCLCLSV